MRPSRPLLRRLAKAVAILPTLGAAVGCAAAPFPPPTDVAPPTAESPSKIPDSAPESGAASAERDANARSSDVAPSAPSAPAPPLSADFLSAAEAASQRRDAAARANAAEPDPDEGRPISSGTCVGSPSKVAQKKLRSEATCCYVPPSYYIQRIRSKNDGFRACYEEALKRHPDARGRVTTKFTIEEDGSVIGACDAGSTVGDPAMVACVLRVFTTVTFEGYTAGGPCPPPTLMYPMVFKPDP